MKVALFFCFAGLITACGVSSNSISIVGPAPATLTSISVTPGNLTLYVGALRQFIATGSYSDGSQQNITASVTWSSAAATVASINNVAGSSGIATAVAAGSTTITAASGTLSGSTTLNVTAVTLVSIGVTPAAPAIAKGTTQQFSATGVYSDNTTQNLTSVVSWHVVNPAVASITTALGSGGLATGVAPGITQITASLGGVIGSTNLTVTAATLVSIDVTPLTATIRIGAVHAQQYTATGHYSDLTTQDITTSVTWNSATTATATISNAAGSNGRATGLAPGTTTVTAALNAITSNSATLTVVAFAYAANFLSDNVSQFLIGTDGTLAAIGAGTVAAGVNPYALVEDPSGKYVYVANFRQPGNIATTISQFAIGADGSLTAIGTGSVAATGDGLNGITVSPTGPYVYTANYGTSDVSQYSIGAGGALTFAATVGAGTGAAAIALNPTGTFAYVANYVAGNVSQYSVSAVDGSLTPLGTVPAGSGPNGVVVDPSSGRFVYVPNNGNGTVSQYSIRVGGTLTSIAPAVMAGAGAWSVTIDSASHNAYVANRDAASVSHFTIDATTGALALANTLLLPAGTGPTSVAIDPSGLFAYIADRGLMSPQATISQCSVATDGTLTLLTPPTAPAGNAPAAIITSR